jgi:hypothetical protein
LNITANNSGHTPIYKVSLNGSVASLAPADLVVSDCIGGEIAGSPPVFVAYLNGALYHELFAQWLTPVCFKSGNVVHC